MNQDIVFECPRCHQWLEAPPDMANLFVECPKCDAVIKVPATSTSPGAPSKKDQDPTPAPPPELAGGDDKLKGTTIRIDLPPNMGIPIAPKRKFTIRRKN